MAVTLDETDFNRLRSLLANCDGFRTAQRRLDFVDDAFRHSPRREAIAGGYQPDGSARAAAARLIDQLCRFGQDAPGHESLARVVDLLLADYIGEGEDSAFLHDLTSRYQLKQASPSPATVTKPGGAQLKQLQQALLDAFSPTDLQMMLSSRLDWQMAHIVPFNASLESAVFEIIMHAQRRGRLSDLVAAARAERPHHAALQALAAQFGVQ